MKLFNLTIFNEVLFSVYGSIMHERAESVDGIASHQLDSIIFAVG